MLSTRIHHVKKTKEPPNARVLGGARTVRTVCQPLRAPTAVAAGQPSTAKPHVTARESLRQWGGGVGGRLFNPEHALPAAKAAHPAFQPPKPARPGRRCGGLGTHDAFPPGLGSRGLTQCRGPYNDRQMAPTLPGSLRGPPPGRGHVTKSWPWVGEHRADPRPRPSSPTLIPPTGRVPRQPEA